MCKALFLATRLLEARRAALPDRWPVAAPHPGCRAHASHVHNTWSSPIPSTQSLEVNDPYSHTLPGNTPKIQPRSTDKPLHTTALDAALFPPHRAWR